MYFCTDKTRHATRKNSAPGRVIQRKIVFILINSGHYPPGASWAVFSNEFSFGFLGFLALPMFFGGAFLKKIFRYNCCRIEISSYLCHAKRRRRFDTRCKKVESVFLT